MAPLLYGGRSLPPGVAGPLFITAAALCLVWAVLAYRSERRYLSRAARATGVVESVTAEQGTRGGTSYFPVISFTTAAGAPVRARSRSSNNRYRVGDSVPVLYDPNEPDDMQIDTLGSRWVMVGFATGLAALFVLIGAVSIVSRQ